MPQFSYTARNAEGTTVHGTLDAENAQSAHSALRSMSMSVEELVELPLSEQVPVWNTMEEEEPPVIPSLTIEEVSPARRPSNDYYPLVETLRLYAGWLLSWYFVIFALGFYQVTNHLPFRIPLLEQLFFSSTVLSFACASFLFLLFSSLHRRIGKGLLWGVFLSLVGFVAFVGFRANM